MMSRKNKTELGPPVGRQFPFFMNDEQVETELTVLQREREKLMKKKKVLELRHEIARLKMEADSSQPPPPPQLHRTQSQGQRRASRRRSSESKRQGEPNTEVYNKNPSPDIERSNREPKTPPRTTPDVTPEFKNPPGTPVQRQDSRTSKSSSSSRTEPPATDRDAPVFRNPPPFDLVGMDTMRGAPPEMTPEVFPPEGSRSRGSQEIVMSPETSTHSKEKEEFLKRRKEKKEGSSSRHGSVRSTASSVRRFSDLAHQPRTGTVTSVRSSKDVRGIPSFESPSVETRGGYAEPVAPPRHRRESDPTSPKSPGQTALFDFSQPSGSVRSRTGPPPGSPPPPPPPPPHPSALPAPMASIARRKGSEPVERNHAVVPDYRRNPPQSPEGAVSLAEFIKQSGVKHQHK
ncbi:serine/arginine repetitive matrix protein 1-like [Branchiostoma floridae]|uniref:Serine/arginine repetitive matrix protein 1-like n=1 Tax=Branchiostoma floridae TaxID=7739 RepID=A0A9J7N695_BRAFL|nr:serine/arginine repetitive matrix protein 1-like [Branchiostoma floridae]